MSEILDIVDENDSIVGKNTRHDSYRNKTINRIIFVCIKNSEWKVLLQKRSSTCWFMPWAWDMSVGWHVSSGQTYEEAAYRELFEEIWIEGIKLDFISKKYWDRKEIDEKHLSSDKITRHESHWFFRAYYEWVYDWELKFDDGEVELAQHFSKEELKQMIENKEFMTPGCIDVILHNIL